MEIYNLFDLVKICIIVIKLWLTIIIYKSQLFVN